MRVQITSKKEGFCRCGVAHSVTPTVHEEGKFTEEQLKRLKDEPMLVVTELADNSAKEKAKKKDAGGGDPDKDKAKKEDAGGGDPDKEKKPEKSEDDQGKANGDK